MQAQVATFVVQESLQLPDLLRLLCNFIGHPALVQQESVYLTLMFLLGSLFLLFEIFILFLF